MKKDVIKLTREEASGIAVDVETQLGYLFQSAGFDVQVLKKIMVKPNGQMVFSFKSEITKQLLLDTQYEIYLSDDKGVIKLMPKIARNLKMENCKILFEGDCSVRAAKKVREIREVFLRTWGEEIYLISSVSIKEAKGLFSAIVKFLDADDLKLGDCKKFETLLEQIRAWGEAKYVFEMTDSVDVSKRRFSRVIIFCSAEEDKFRHLLKGVVSETNSFKGMNIQALLLKKCLGNKCSEDNLVGIKDLSESDLNGARHVKIISEY